MASPLLQWIGCSAASALFMTAVVVLSTIPLTEARTMRSAQPNEATSSGLCASTVARFGYPCQEFQVVTEDGYILGVQRIPNGKRGLGGVGSNNKQSSPPPVIIQHGVLVDGSTWFLNSADENLPLILADNGFDVWIANTRGTRFSRSHLTLNPNSSEYWDWSWDELAAYDLPATFDLVYNHTSQKSHYIGHSLGTLTLLAALSEGHLLDRVRSAALLSPVAYLSHMTTALGVLVANVFLGEVLSLLGVAEFNPKGKEVDKLLKDLCLSHGVDCYDLLSALTGKNCCLNSSTIKLFLENEPQSTSMKNMVHLAQTVRCGVLAKYNYPDLGSNLKHYGELIPPFYNLSNVPREVPLFLIYGGNDALSDIQDVTKLLGLLKLGEIDNRFVLYKQSYAHADFIMGTNAKDEVYNNIMRWVRGGLDGNRPYPSLAKHGGYGSLDP